MSAIFGASTKWLSTILTGTVPTPNTNLLVAAWYKIPSVNADDVLVQVKASSEDSLLRLVAIAGPKLRCTGRWNGSTQNADQVSNFTLGTWRLAGCFLPLDDGTSKNVKCWDNGATKTTSLLTPNTATQDLTALSIGQGLNFNSFSFWNGRAAETSALLVGSEADADTIMTALATTRAPDVSLPGGSSLIFYRDLLSGITGTGDVGAALTNNGSVTFDNADHPALGGGGGNAAGALANTDPLKSLVNGGLAA